MKFFFLTFFFLPTIIFAQVEKRLEVIQKMGVSKIQANATVVLKELHQVLDQARKERNKKVEAKTLSLISWTSYFAGNYEDNKRYSLAAITLFQRLNMYPELAREYGELGFRMKDVDLQNAEKNMQKGIYIGIKHETQKELTGLFNNYGSIKMKQHQRDSALYYYSKSADLCVLLNDSIGMTYSYNNIGDLYMKSGRQKLAKSYFDKALHIRIAQKDTYGIADSYAYLGDLYLAESSYEQAVQYFLKSIEIAKKNHITNLMRHDYSMLAVCYEKLRDFEQALYYANKRQVLGDSLISIATNEKIVAYQARFETAEKEKALLYHQLLEKKRKTTILILIISLFGITIIGILITRALRLKNRQQKQAFELKEAIATIDTQNKLQEQRLRISRDLHDNIGAQLTFIISSIETLKYTFKITDEKINQKLNSISAFTKETITELRDTIWAMNHESIGLYEIHDRLSNFIEKAKSTKEHIQFIYQIDSSIENKEFSSVQGMNCYRIVQEAVNNALKYADATEIALTIKAINDTVQFQVTDNGKGFDMGEINAGNGLQNMKKRADDIQANFELYSELEVGTKITFFVSVKE